MPHPLIDQLEERTFTVEEYLTLVNELLSPLHVSVEGEVTDLKILPQWVFFALKDPESNALLRCGLHAGQYRKLGVNIEEGMQVKVEGYGKLAAKSGNFGFWVSSIEPVGEGALRRAYELLVQKLKDEGLFARKRDLPPFIRHIGVISSRNGVVIQDLRNNLEKLGIRIDFLHSGVEGADSAQEILRAVQHFSHTTDAPDVLVLIRGGGSLESLQGFNNEAVVRELYSAPMPVLVGIGHDVDAPIATMVADWSASTPTAVAHVINRSWSPLTETMPRVVDRVLAQYSRLLEGEMRSLALSERSLANAVRMILGRLERVMDLVVHQAHTGALWATRACERVTHAKRIMARQLHTLVEQQKGRVRELERYVQAADPELLLARGYAIARGTNGKVIRSVQDTRPGDLLSVRLADGTLNTKVESKQ